ncbi:MAG: neuraminidase-like domain-containing protein [Endomicrobia bacterium]|nr:neuraminidase-like domain-containing protein [Endomicrobiia bacterium]
MITNTVFGKVTDTNDRPLANVKVEIFDAGMREWQLLAETFTDRDGKYEIAWQRDQVKERTQEKTDIAVKVLTKKTNTEIFRSSIDEVSFDASDREEINIKIRQPLPKEDVEFTFLVTEVTALAKRISIADLQENDEHRDITFLSKELGVLAEKIEHFVMAHRLSNSSKINPVFFYGLFRMNTLLHTNTENKNARLSIGLADDENIILYDLALTDQGKIYNDIQQAAKEMIIPPMEQKYFANSLTIINTYIQKAVNYYENEHPKKINNLFNNIFTQEKIQEMSELLKNDKKNINAFFEKLFDPSLFAVKKEEKAVAREQIKGLDKAVINKITLSRKIEKAEDIKKLARLNKSEWMKELSNVSPDIKEEQLSGYASSLARRMEMEFPTVAFAAQLERAKTPVLKNQEKIVSFLNKHDDFDLTRDNVDLYLKDKKVENQEAINEELKSVQRVFRLTPNYSKTMALREENIKSSQSILAIGKKRFVNDIAPKAGIDAQEAERIYQLAETRSTAAMLMLGNLRDSMTATGIAAFDKSLSIKKGSYDADFPNLKTLFQLVDTLECEHCRSVYSPAAYLVEILQFLKNRKTFKRDNTGNKIPTNAKIELFKRRPDLGDIELGGHNSNTPVKYIDLVCEILEDAIVPYDCSRQTFGTAEELDTAPEYVNDAAYGKLAASEYAFKLPFDLSHTEAKEYFNRFGVNRADLMSAFQSGSTLTDANIAAERLGLTETERNIIVTPANSNARQQDFWNVPAPGSALNYLKRVDQFLDKTGLTYKEMDLLLKLKFINNNNLYIRHDAEESSGDTVKISGDTTKKFIENLDLDGADCIHRFLRLQKKTGLKFEVLDEIISQERFGSGQLDENCLIKIAEIKEIAEKTNLKIEELIGCFGEIPHAVLTDGVKPLYNQIFLNKAKSGTIDEYFLPENVASGSKPLNNDDGSIAYLAACLQLKPADLAFLTPFLPDDDKLSFSNLSYLFAASKLMAKLKIKTEDFVVISKLSGINFSSGPKETLAFINTVEDFKRAPLHVNDIDFILNHNNIDKEIKDEKIEELLVKLKKGYEDVCDEYKSKYDDNLSSDEQKETLQTELSKLNGITEDDVKIFSQFIDCNWKFEWIDDDGVVTECSTPAGAAAYLEYKLASWINIVPIRDMFDPLDNAFNTYTANSEDQSAIDSFEDARKELVESFLDEIAAFHTETNKQTLLEQTISSAFKLDLDLTETALEFAKLKQSLSGNELLNDLLFGNFDDEINETNYAKQYEAIRLIFKMASLINAFKLSAAETEWYLENNAALAWFEMDGIPYQQGQTAVSLSTFLEFSKIVSWSRQMAPVIDPMNAEQPASFFSIIKLIQEGTASQDEFINLMSLLSGYEKEGLKEIDERLFTSFDIVNYKNIENWERLFECADLARKLGATISQIEQFINPTLSPIAAKVLRENLQTRYDENTWLSALKEIMDAIRPQKRKALAAYLLAKYPDSFKNENDLYEHYLVDVEMEAAMPSSRIVLAHNSIQLFVQRCLMGLEPNAIANIEDDPEWNQWQWMKNYRVWEANRKIFLYPENWYDVTLTDDKSYLLKEFIDEIQQNELTDEIAEEAVIKYLEKLDDIAFLEVMATWYDVSARIMHVFARTKGGEPYIYYYRRFESERYWSPWEKVELDIAGDHLLAFMRNNRLCLAWPMFSEEPQSDQTVEIPSAGDKSATLDKPKKKLKIQMAISEYSNGKWKPKKISSETESLTTPGEPVFDPDPSLTKENYQFVYNQIHDQIWIVRRDIKSPEFPIIKSSNTNSNDEYQYKICGKFDITGCKGYLELNKDTGTIDSFFPEFHPTKPVSQRYQKTKVTETALSVTNLEFPISEKVLGKTPDIFNITFPHQRTEFDIQTSNIYKILNYGKNVRDNTITAFGSMLPYFFEDKKHAYVIIPGFYKVHCKYNKLRPDYGLLDYLSDEEKFTASDLFQLIDDFVKWFISKTNEKTPPENGTIVKEFFEKFLTKIRKINLNIFELLVNALKNFFNNSSIDIDAFLKEFGQAEQLQYGEQFKNMYHPLVCPLRGILYKEGVPALMKRNTQRLNSGFDFEKHYDPTPNIVPQMIMKNPDGSAETIRKYPIEDIDFESDGSYSVYNWDLFFRIPLHIATTLTQNQRFEEALTWFHYMFNPTGALDGKGVQKFWVTKPFYLNQSNDYISQRIDELMYNTADKTNPANKQAIKDLEHAVSEWRKKPFRPDVIARFRPVAYQKALLMKYIDNLIEWGDYLFRQDTMESIAQATQMYVLADKLLGPKPRVVPAPYKQPYETYNQIEAKIDSFGNALIELENILPDLSVQPQEGNELPPPPVTLLMLYFCIPPNEKMSEYWDRVADRLFKIRHCQNIDGIERSLALFAPPIDPGMLARAAASGLSLSSILAGLNAPTPYYRFNILSQKATELAQEVRGLGNSLLMALEKKDAEALSLLRNELELKVLNAVTDIKKLQIDEAKEQIEVLKRTKIVTEERQKYYSSIEKIIPKEQLNLDKLGTAMLYSGLSQATKILAAALRPIPETKIGASGFGGTPHVTVDIPGGDALSKMTDFAADTLNLLSSIASYEANKASILGGYERRWDDWKLQERLATKELDSIDKQIKAAEFRKEIAEKDLANHELQIENAKKTDEAMRSKYTNKELYDWMIGQISSVYFKSYQLAHDFAKKAEMSYRFELGNDDTFISYGYWDSMKKGLQSADMLIHDIKRMETAYLDKNKREYEITKHVSLAQLDPLALLRLRKTGVCDFEIPEALYDMDHPGQYFRRLKSVSVSLPCVAGPYTSVSAKLSLINNRYRKNTNDLSNYAENMDGDGRFVYNVGAIQSIATSNAQNDSGMFELNFRDERFLPFENTGAVSSWRLELPAEVKQFDYNTISDVILHVKYTAREGGSVLKAAANGALVERLNNIKQSLKSSGLHIAINLKHDLPNEWHLLKTNGNVNLTIDKSRLPYMVNSLKVDNIKVMFISDCKNLKITVDDDVKDITLASTKELGELGSGIYPDISLDKSFNLSVNNNNLEELFMVVKYTFGETD